MDINPNEEADRLAKLGTMNAKDARALPSSKVHKCKLSTLINEDAYYYCNSD